MDEDALDESAVADDHGSHPGHHHDEPAWGASWRARLTWLGVAMLVLLLYATSVVRSVAGIDTALLVAAAAGWRLVARAGRALRARQINYDVTIALAALVALVAGEYLAAAEVTLIVIVGDALEHWAIHRADRAIAEFVSLQPARASVIRDGVERQVPSADVRLTDIVIVRGGERVPVDGVVVDGHAGVDQALVTGEPVAAHKGPGDRVFSGSLVEHGALDLRPEQVGSDTTVARIARFVGDAKRRRAPIVRMADRLSRWLLPGLVVGATAVYFLTGDALRGVAVLLVGCSCALVYAAPAAFSAALARLGRGGVLVKGGDVLERLASVTAVAFDKTGTLTLGQPAVIDVIAVDDRQPNDVLALAAAAEGRAEHCIGRAILAEAARRGLRVGGSQRFSQQPGMGVTADVDDVTVAVGSLAFLRERGATSQALERAATAVGQAGEMRVGVAAGNRPVGLIILRDVPRPDAARAIAALRAAGGVRRIAMITGDAEEPAHALAAQVGIHAADVFAALLPADKIARVGDLARAKADVLMVGDGINDAPALAAAHVGIAFGRGAADLSAEAADVVVLDPSLEAIPELLLFARKTVQRVRFNILAFALGVNAVAILAAGFGYLTPPAAAILHQVVSLVVILSSVSLLIGSRRRASADVPTWRSMASQAGSWMTERIGNPALAAMRRHERVMLRALGAAAIAGWALSGVAIIGPSESAIVQRFGRVVASDLGPGLHVRAPWPIETVTRASTRRVRVLDIGFRAPALSGGGGSLPQDYEWNTPHDASGAVQQVPDENLVLTGDENLAELYGVVHYRVANLSQYLFGAREPEAMVRVLAEGTLRAVAANYSLDALLTTDRKTLEDQWSAALGARLAGAGIGIEVLGIHLSDVHPPVDVVAAFRDVASAQEEQLMSTLTAEAYAKEELPLARGKAAAMLEQATGYKATRTDRSQGDAARFLAESKAAGLPLTRFRLQLEAFEAVLAGRAFTIIDEQGGKRSLTIVDGARDLLLKLLGGEGGGDPEHFAPGKDDQ